MTGYHPVKHLRPDGCVQSYRSASYTGDIRKVTCNTCLSRAGYYTPPNRGVCKYCGKTIINPRNGKIHRNRTSHDQCKELADDYKSLRAESEFNHHLKTFTEEDITA